MTDLSTSCLILHHNFVTEYPQLPHIGLFVQFSGYFLCILLPSGFAVEVDDLNYTFPSGVLLGDDAADEDAA